MGPARHVTLSCIPLLFLLAGASPQNGKEKSLVQAGQASQEKLNAEVIATMRAYRASLQKLLRLYEEEVKKKAGRVQELRDYFEKGFISKLELDQSRQQLSDSEAKLRDTQQKIAEVDAGIAEATALAELLRLPPLAAGQYIETGNLIRYNGKARWSLSDAGRIQKFFSQRFGRALPVSALGQTPVHDRMKFDHHDAMDVALHPDSSEGRALMAYLRQTGIPFMAFRNLASGSATGAHIHIGRPSVRVASP